MNLTIKISSAIPLVIFLVPAFLTLTFKSQAVNAATLQEKAAQYCNNKYKGNSQKAKNERINCRKGFKAGYNGGDKNNVCHPPLAQASINACTDGFDKGKAVAPSGGGGGGNNNAGNNNQGQNGGVNNNARNNQDGISLGTQGSNQCGNLPDEEDNWKTKINFGCLGEDGPSGLGPIQDLIFALIRFLTIGVGIIITMSIIAAGIQYTTAEGNAEASQKAKKRIQNAVIGLAIFIFTWSALQFLIPGGLFR